MHTIKERTVILGFDALSFEYLDEFDLPNFDSIRSTGVETGLDSTFPPWTGSAWPSLFTGVSPDRHGVYSFFDFAGTYPDDAGVITRNDVRAPAIWNYLSAREIPSVVLNVPATHPAEPIEGGILPGYLAPEEADGHPETLRADLSAELDEEYRIYSSTEGDTNSDVTVEDFLSLIDLRRRAAVELLENKEWNFAMIQVQKTDTVFHKFKHESAFEQVYEAADDFLGAVLETVDDDVNVIVCSDHGIGRTTGYNIYVNEILRQHGFVEAKTDGCTPTLGGEKTQLTDNEDRIDRRRPSERAVSAIESALSRVGIMPGDVYSVAQRLGLESALQRVVPTEAISTVGEHVDWQRSTAYCRSGPELGIRINLKGREPTGVVSKSEYDDVRDRLIGLLSSLRTPDGALAFEWVKPREAVYDGQYADEACDVLFMPKDMNNLVATNLLGTQFVSIDKYNHKRQGVFIGFGPGFRYGAQSPELSITDVAPIAMALLGQAVPDRMTGTVPSTLVARSPERDQYGDIEYGTDALSNTGDEVVDRLKGLGYV